MTIGISESIQQDMIAHARSEYPNECCGYVLGVGNTCEYVYKMTNIDHSPVHFSFDPKEQFSAIKYARSNQQELLVVYHSHPDTAPELSEEDMRLLNDPNMVYVIVSLKDNQPVLKAFRIRNKQSTVVDIVKEALL